jgi:hypothetical protein
VHGPEIFPPIVANDVHYRVYGVRFLLNHGDMLGVKGGDGIIGAIGPIMRGEQHNDRPVPAFDRIETMFAALTNLTCQSRFVTSAPE